MGDEKTPKPGDSGASRFSEKESILDTPLEASPMLGGPIKFNTVERLHKLIGNQAVQRLIRQGQAGASQLTDQQQAVVKQAEAAGVNNSEIEKALQSNSDIVQKPDLSANPDMSTGLPEVNTPPTISMPPDVAPKPDLSANPDIVQKPSTSSEADAPPTMSDVVQKPDLSANSDIVQKPSISTETPQTSALPAMSANPDVMQKPSMSTETSTSPAGAETTGKAKATAASSEVGQPTGPNLSVEPDSASVSEAQAAAPGGMPVELVKSELAEHQRWGKVGQAQSAERAQFIASNIGKGMVAGGTSGLEMGLGVGAGTRGLLWGAGKAAKAWGPRILENASGFTPVPAIGAIIGGAFAVHGLVTRNWSQSWNDVKSFGKGSSNYEKAANTIQSIATILEVLSGVASTIAGIMGLTAAVMWGFAVLTGGVLSPLAATLTSIAGIISVVTNIVDLINQTVLQPMVVLFRALHTFKTDAAPDKVSELGVKLSESAAGPAAALGAFAGGKIAETKMPGGSKDAPEVKSKVEQDNIAPAQDGPKIEAKEPLPGADRDTPAVTSSEPEAPVSSRGEGDVSAPADELDIPITVEAEAPVKANAGDAPAIGETPLGPEEPTGGFMASALGENQNQNLELSHPNTVTNPDTGISEPGGPFELSVGRRPEDGTGRPLGDATDAEFDALFDDGLKAGEFQQVDIAPLEPNMPYTEAQLKTMSETMSPEQVKAKEGFKRKIDDPAMRKPDGSFLSPLNPPGTHGFETPGSPAAGPHHGATGHTTAGSDGTPKFHASEVFSVTPNKPTYAVRGGTPGNYVDHIFNTQHEALAYAEMMSKRPELQLRRDNAVKVDWNKMDAMRVFEVPPNTPILRSQIGPQFETAPGYPTRWEGGGPQTQLPYGTINKNSKMVGEFEIKNRAIPPAPDGTSSATPTPDLPTPDLPTPVASVPAPDGPLPDAPVPVADGPMPGSDGPTPDVSVASSEPSRPEPIVDPESWVGDKMASVANMGGGEGSLETSKRMAAAEARARSLPALLHKRSPGYRSRSFAKWMAKGHMKGEREEEERKLLEAAEQQRQTVTIPVTPDYPTPPGTPADVEALGEEISELGSQSQQAGQMESRAAHEVKEGQKNESTMDETISQTDASMANAKQLSQEVEGRQNTNQKASEEQKGVVAKAEDWAGKVAGLATLKGLLYTFRGAAGIVSYIPSDSVKSYTQAGIKDANNFLAKLNEADATMSGVKGGTGAQQAELGKDKQRLDQTQGQNVQTQQQLETTKAGAEALKQQNAERTDNAETVKTQAAQQRSQITKEINQRTDQKQELSEKLASWSQGHAAARQQASVETQAELKAKGFEITNVKNV